MSRTTSTPSSTLTSPYCSLVVRTTTHHYYSLLLLTTTTHYYYSLLLTTTHYYALLLTAYRLLPTTQYYPLSRYADLAMRHNRYNAKALVNNLTLPLPQP